MTAYSGHSEKYVLYALAAHLQRKMLHIGKMEQLSGLGHQCVKIRKVLMKLLIISRKVGLKILPRKL